MYTKEEEIIHYIFIAYQGQKRKKEDIEVCFHSIMVGNMLKNLNCDEETIYIGYLHDIIEDTNYTYEDLLKKYDQKIADGVLMLTEDKTISNYVERKKNFLEKLSKIDNKLLLVELADKLQNLLSDYNLFIEKGKESLITECDTFDELQWYYLELKKLFNSKLENNILLERYNKIVDLYFN